MYFIRRMAVNAIRVLGQSPEKIAEAYNFDRSCIYRWLKQYDEGGFEALESKMPPGAEPLITSKTDEWLRQTILTCTPIEFGYDTNLWTCAVLAKLLEQKLGVAVSDIDGGINQDAWKLLTKNSVILNSVDRNISSEVGYEPGLAR